MSPALFYLLTRSFANAIRLRFARLKKPKYAFGALFGAAYFYFYFYRFLFRGGFHPGGQARAPKLFLGLTDDLKLPFAALVLFVILLAFAWIFPASRAALAMTEAEVSWLLPGPITRAQLIRYKLLKSQLGLLLMAVLMTLATGRFARDGHAWIHTMGWWIVFSTIQLHRLGASFLLTRWMDRGLTNWKRRLIVSGIAGVIVGVIVYWGRQVPEAPSLHEAMTDGALGPWLAEAVSAGPARWILAPFQLVVTPWFANDAGTFVHAVWPAALVLVLHYLWVIACDVSFEEASIQLSERRAKLLAARRSGDMRFNLGGKRTIAEPVFRLHPTGWVVPAFMWKSFLQAGGRRKAMWQGLLGIAAIAFVSMSNAPTVHSMGSMIGMVVIMITLFSTPQLTAQNVRQELGAADVFKMAPVRGWEVVLGQLLGPAVRWAMLQALAVSLMLVSASRMPGVPDILSAHGAVALAGACLILPPFNVAAALVPTGMMLLFPGWWRPGEMRGVEASGMGIIMVVAQLFAVSLSMILPALAAIGVFLATSWVAGADVAILTASTAAATALAVEAWLGTLALGAVFERYDASEER